MKTYHCLNIAIDFEFVINTFNPDYFSILDNNKSNFCIAWGVDDILVQPLYKKGNITNFEKKNANTYAFGYIGYDAKNCFYNTTQSNNKDYLNLAESIFYIPKHVVIKKNNHLLYYGTKANFEWLCKQKKVVINTKNKQKVNALTCSTSKNDYLNTIKQIKQHLQQGNIYEMNYCINFSSVLNSLNSIETFKTLKSSTKAPFSVYSKFKTFEILSASPERFYLKHNNAIISQPIKGTAPRGNNLHEDELIKNSLQNNTKEISENIMIVDLVRNDLSKIATKNSVIVSELCKIYSFETVHQIISTVEAKLSENCSTEQILEALFPMGSMTGAPKLKSIELIEEFENFKRNIYSGSFGFITPNKNADFNVVIRTIIYNTITKMLNISVGGAITIKSNALQEYNECLLKLKAIEASIVAY